MTNQERIKEYLVGKNGYLKSAISNGKVIMLSGKWGSGKTHFWQNEIATDTLKEELKNKREVYLYISLYGKTSIEEIENDIFSQAYSSAIGGENFVTKGFSTFTKKMKRFGSTKIANGLKEEQQDNIERTALSRLNNGGIICLDDFERKSKDIDLNDLFGFITQLTINFQCKVVIILNDDVFEGKEKDIFSNVKEKTVSKFLHYNSEIGELFNLIFKEKIRKEGKDFLKYEKLFKYEETILKTFKKIKELNARIYIQVFDNLIEYIKEKNNVNEKYIIFLILVNVNFILNHHSIEVELIIDEEENYNPQSGTIIKNHHKEFLQLKVKSNLVLPNKISQYLKKIYDEKINFGMFKHYISLEENGNSKGNGNYTNDNEALQDFIDENINFVKSEMFLMMYKDLVKFESNNDSEKYFFNEINNFIETGILIKDS